MNLFRCLECNKDFVPELIISTIDPPQNLNLLGEPRYLEARTVMSKKPQKGDQHAISLSEKLFFLENHLYYQLINKMKLFCKNSLFSLKINIVITDSVIAATASGTALCLKALPLPMPLKIIKSPK